MDNNLRAYASSFSDARKASCSTSPGVRQSPAMSMDSRAITEGEISFACSADSDELFEDWEVNLDPQLIRIRSHLVKRLVETYTNTESKVQDAIQHTAPGEPPSSSQGSSGQTSSSPSRTTQTSKTSLGKHKASEDKDEDDENVQDEDSPSRRERTRVTTESISLDGRLLACPYCKYDPIRFSECNIEEKPYRGCSSSYLSTISRLKQHLYRVHRRPDFYCRSCFEVFLNEGQLDLHSRTRPSCEPSEPKFAEKMTTEQMASVKRRKPGKTATDTWFAIFRILFPQAPLPASPYVDSVSAAAVRAFMDHFQRHAQAVLSGLIQEQLGGTLVLHSDQERILDSALESAIAQLVMRIGPTDQQVERRQIAFNSSQAGFQRLLDEDLETGAFEDGSPESQLPQEPEIFLASAENSDTVHPPFGSAPTSNIPTAQVLRSDDQGFTLDFSDLETSEVLHECGFDIFWQAPQLMLCRIQ